MKLECLSKPAKTNKRGSILFVHGICHGAWCWHHYQAYFSENGYDTYAMSLRGHGQSEGHAQINEWGLDHYCDDVINIISSLETPPIIVGHSMGGAITERLLARNPSLVKAAVFLAREIRWLHKNLGVKSHRQKPSQSAGASKLH